MNTYHIQVANITKRNQYFKVFFFFMFPLLGLLLYHQRNPIIALDATTELVIILTFSWVPPLILGIKTKDAYANEAISFSNGEIQTNLLGPIKFADIEKCDYPSVLDSTNKVFRIHLKTGNKIEFSEKKTDF